MASTDGQVSQYVRRKEGLTAIPVKAINIQHLQLLDLSGNSIEVVPASVLKEVGELTALDLSYNALTALCEEISYLQDLRVLKLAGNKLTALPNGLCKVTSLVELHVQENKLSQLTGEWFNLTNLQVLDVSKNALRVVPADVGWLPLEQLRVGGNPDLRIPETVLQRGFRGIMSYLQVICEQHRLVEQHLDKFVAPAGAAASASSDPSILDAAVDKKIALAAQTGVLDLRGCGNASALHKAAGLQTVYVVDARGSQWHELPQAVMGFAGLVVLNAAHNSIDMIPAATTPESLGVLNLSFNQLTALPSTLGQSPVLQQMYVANNQLEDLPESFAQLPMVDLFLSENKFTTIPPAVLGMTQLAKLSIACCRITEVPEGIRSLPGLRFLDISFNQLTTLPGSISCLTSLNALNVSFNPLQHVPAVVGCLTALLELNLDYTGVRSFPPEIGGLRKLEGLQAEGCPLEAPLDVLYEANPLLLVQVHNSALVSLDLSGLGLQEVPRALGRLHKLQALNLAKNKITDLPVELGRLTGLQMLNLKGNPLRQPFARVAEVLGERALVDLMNVAVERLELANCGFDAVPQEVAAHAPHLQQLKLAGNKLSALPDFLQDFQQLNTVVLDNNFLRTLPVLLLRLPKLSILMASCNNISELPENLGDCTQLQALVLQGNQISHVPASISRLLELKALSLASNKLESLPEGLGACTSLRLLDIGHNRLHSLPASLGGLHRLKTLKLAQNKLSWVPGQLTGLDSIQEVFCAGNDIKVPGLELSATNAADAKKLLAAMVQATASLAAAYYKQQQDQQRQAQASVDVPASAASPEAGRMSLNLEAVADRVVTQVDELRQESMRERQKPAPAPDSIPTQEAASPEITKNAVDALSSSLGRVFVEKKPQKWLYVQKHLEDNKLPSAPPKPSGWDAVSIMDIPKVIAALSAPPPPPPRPMPAGTTGTDGGSEEASAPTPMRPQTKHRFKRLADQATLGLKLLDKLEEKHSSQGPAWK